MTTNTHLANSQRSNPYFSDWAAMKLPPEPGRTAFDWRRDPVDPSPALTRLERDRAKGRERARAKYIPAAVRNAAITEFKGTHLNKGPLNESPAAKAKTAKLLKAGI